MSQTIIDLKKIEKVYKDAQGTAHAALNGVDLQVTFGEFVSVMGPSGCGKTSLAQIIGLLSSPSSGEIQFLNRTCSKLSDTQLTKLRGLYIGYIFQDYVLIDHLSVLQNVMLAFHMRSLSDREIKNKATELLVDLGLESHLKKSPNQLSGGQKQRVAIARSLIKSPKLILADEPVGALDPESRLMVLTRLKKINEAGTTIVMVTHNQEDTKWGTRIVRMEKGQVTSDEKIQPT